MISFRKISLYTALIIIIPALALASTVVPWSCKVVGISDGDTITVMEAGRGVKVRLAEIDCPEKRQPFGAKAKQFTSNLCFGKIVTIKPTDIDRYGRVVGHVVLSDGRILNEELIKAGLAWQYRKYSNSRKLAQLESEARTAKIGLWSDPNPVPPWGWRKSGTSSIQKQPQKLQTPGSSQSGQYHGNVKSRVFHGPGCRYFNCKNCTAVFSSRNEAMQAGYRPCKICKP